MDAFYRHMCRIEQFQYALFLIATIVSRPAPNGQSSTPAVRR